MAFLVISLDFELRWGVLDKVYEDADAYRDNLISVHENVPWILELFNSRGIHATWATVGALACDNWDEFEAVRPSMLPAYKNKKMEYVNEINKIVDPEGKLYFAPDLVQKIIETPGQELGTHTFGHIYATEPDVTYEQLLADLHTCKSFLKKKFSYTPTSLVYPRNQVIYEERLLEEKVVECYRGNEDVDYLSAENQRGKKLFNRVKILLDAINPFSSHAYEFGSITKNNIKSSAMFRIYLSGILRRMHLAKLKYSISRLKDDEVYHIWFHPHNLGTCQKRKNDFIDFVDFIEKKITSGKLQSLTMGEVQKMVGK